jgi:CheY-like chemotaxis protein
LKAQTEQLDVILLDVMMPELDGLATLQKLRSDPTSRYIPVILLTAKGRSLDQSQLTQLEIRGTINKPFNPRKLVDQVAMLLGKA